MRWERSDTTVATSHDNVASTIGNSADDHALGYALDNGPTGHAGDINVDKPNILHTATKTARNIASFFTPLMLDDRRGSCGCGCQEVAASLLDAISDSRECHQALVQDSRLVIVQRLAIFIKAFFTTALCPTRQGGAEILRNFAYRSNGLGGQTGSVGGEGVDPANMLSSRRLEGDWLRIWLGLFRETVGLALQCSRYKV